MLFERVSQTKTCFSFEGRYPAYPPIRRTYAATTTRFPRPTILQRMTSTARRVAVIRWGPQTSSERLRSCARSTSYAWAQQFSIPVGEWLCFLPFPSFRTQ